MTISGMTDTTKIPTLAHGPLAGVPMPFMQEGMCSGMLTIDADPMRSRCCGEPVPEGVAYCEHHDA